MQLHIVGSGCPDAKPERYGSAFVLDIDEHAILIDCGPGTSYKMAHMSPNFARPGVKERAIAELARSYTGDIFCPDELTTLDLST